MAKGLASPVPVATQLPGVFSDDDFLPRFTAAFDDALAPVFATLDALFAYVDPNLAPEDFLEWLADWVGVDLDDAWPLGQRRAAVAGAATVHRRRGTRAGLADAVRLAIGGDVEVIDSGGSAWSEIPGSQLPGSATPSVTVRVAVEDPDALDARRVDAVVAAVKPAHVPHVVEVIRTDVG